MHTFFLYVFIGVLSFGYVEQTYARDKYCEGAILGEHHVLRAKLNKDGFAIFKLPAFMAEGERAAYLKAVPRGWSFFSDGRFAPFTENAKRLKKANPYLLLDKEPKKIFGLESYKDVAELVYGPLEPYINFISAELQNALPGEDLELLFDQTTVRTIGKDQERRAPVPYGLNAREYHTDGGYIGVLFVIEGSGTIARDKNGEHQTQVGEALILTADGRADIKKIKATIHRGPSVAEDRVFVELRFRPRWLR